MYVLLFVHVCVCACALDCVCVCVRPGVCVCVCVCVCIRVLSACVGLCKCVHMCLRMRACALTSRRDRESVCVEGLTGEQTKNLGETAGGVLHQYITFEAKSVMRRTSLSIDPSSSFSTSCLQKRCVCVCVCMCACVRATREDHGYACVHAGMHVWPGIATYRPQSRV